MDKTLKNAAHRLEEMIKECTWQDTIPCSWKNFTRFKTADGDLCYTFNSGKSGSKMTTSSVGAKTGLSNTGIFTIASYKVSLVNFKTHWTVGNPNKQADSPIREVAISVQDSMHHHITLHSSRQTDSHETHYYSNCLKSSRHSIKHLISYANFLSTKKIASD